MIFTAWLFSKDDGLGLWLAWKSDCRLLELSHEASCRGGGAEGKKLQCGAWCPWGRKGGQGRLLCPSEGAELAQIRTWTHPKGNRRLLPVKHTCGWPSHPPCAPWQAPLTCCCCCCRC